MYFYEIELARVRKAIENTRYESRQDGVGERGFSDYHVDAIMDYISNIIEDIIDEAYNRGYEDGKEESGDW